MGLIARAFDLVFGDGRNALVETAGAFRENAEAGAARQSAERMAVQAQFEAEFAAPRTGWFDRVMDAVNRLPRPALALGTLGMFVAAMVDPVWFAARMQGIALVPEPLWWLLGVIVSFYFGARHQFKGHKFRRSILQSAAHAPEIARSMAALDALEPAGLDAASPRAADTGTDADIALIATAPDTNPALQAWRRIDR